MDTSAIESAMEGLRRARRQVEACQVGAAPGETDATSGEVGRALADIDQALRRLEGVINALRWGYQPPST